MGNPDAKRFSESMSRYAGRWRFALAFLREPRRVVVVCLTVALGCMALVISDGFIERTLLLFREGIIRAHFAHLQVRPAVEDGQIDGEMTRELRALVERELSAYGRTVVTARLSFAGLIARGEQTVGFLGEGVEPAGEAHMSQALQIDTGTNLADDRSRQVLLGAGLARSIGASAGESVTLLVNLPETGGVNGIELEVAGIFHTATKAYDDRALRVPLSIAQELVRSDGISRLMVLLPRTEQTASATRTLKAAMDGRAVDVVAWTELADFYNKTVELFRRQLNFVRAVIFIIVLLSTFNSMARKVLEQQREIGTMMALGMRRKSVAGKFVGEALVIGAVGGAIGVASGGLLAMVVTYIGIPMPPPPGTSRGFTGGIDFSASTAAFSFALALAVCIIASLVPALRASRIVIADALRAER